MQHRLREIERLRALAVLMVIVSHIPFFHSVLPTTLCQTYTGVDLFFVISGFVVYMSFCRYLPEIPALSSPFTRLTLASFAIRKFFWRRVCRILPLAFVWSLVPLTVVLLSTDRSVYNDITNYQIYGEFVSVVTFLYNYASIFQEIPGLLGYYWSLAVEEHFYIFLPFFVVLVRSESRRFWIVFAGCCATVFLVRPLVPFNGTSEQHWEWVRFATHNRIDALGLGVILAILSRRIPATALAVSKSIGSIMVGYLCIAALCLVPGAYLAGRGMMVHFNLIIYSVAAGGLVFLAVQDRGIVLNVGSANRLLEALGARSYALYLIHMPAYWFSMQIGGLLGLNQSLRVVLWVLLLGTLVEASHQLIEKPMIRYGRGCERNPQNVSENLVA